jgi:O-antigen ligase
VVIALVAVFTVVVFALLQAAFWIDEVPTTARVLLAGVALVSAIRPAAGLLAIAILVPLADVGGPMLGADVRDAEVLILAGLAGALVRAWWSRAVLRFPSDGLETAALVFALIVAASYVEQIWFSQIQTDFPARFLDGLWSYASRNYLVSFRDHGGTLFGAMLLLEGLALLVWGARLARADTHFARRLMTAAALGAVAAAAFTVMEVAAEVREAGRPLSASLRFVSRYRWGIHVRDVNAAGAYFAFALFLCGGRVLGSGRQRTAWFAATALVALAFWLTDSRTAQLVVLLFAVAAFGIALLGDVPWNRRLLITVPVALSILVLVALTRNTARGSSELAMAVRREFLATTARMLEWQPLSGVGIGQYNLWSQHFSSPALLEIYRTENAHNNFAQVAGELGWPGLAAFAAVLIVGLLRWRKALAIRGIVWTDLVALLAFITTWLGNHPLLQAVVAYPFWIALGGVPDATRVDSPSPPAVRGRTAGLTTGGAGLVLATVAVLALSLPLRVDEKTSVVDWGKIAFGFYPWEGKGVDRVRWMRQHARFFLPADVTRFQLPVQGLVSEDDPIAVDLLLDGRPAGRIEIDDWEQRIFDIQLPGTPRRHAWQIDLVASRSFVPAERSERNRDTRELSVRVWPITLFGPGNTVIDAASEAPAVARLDHRRDAS